MAAAILDSVSIAREHAENAALPHHHYTLDFSLGFVVFLCKSAVFLFFFHYQHITITITVIKLLDLYDVEAPVHDIEEDEGDWEDNPRILVDHIDVLDLGERGLDGLGALAQLVQQPGTPPLLPAQPINQSMDYRYVGWYVSTDVKYFLIRKKYVICIVKYYYRLID